MSLLNNIDQVDVNYLNDHANRLTWLDDEVSRHEFVFLVFFRGSWCGYCRDYMFPLNDLYDRVRTNGGQIIALTAQKDCPAKNDWSLRFPLKIDARCTVQKTFRLAITERAGYKHGLSQPGIVVLRRRPTTTTTTTTSSSENDVTSSSFSTTIPNLVQCDIVYYWRIEPSLMNIGGASDRPNLVQVMDFVLSKLDAHQNGSGNGSGATHNDTDSLMIPREQKIESWGKSISPKILGIYFKWSTWRYLLMPCCCCCFNMDDGDDDHED